MWILRSLLDSENITWIIITPSKNGRMRDILLLFHSLVISRRNAPETLHVTQKARVRHSTLPHHEAHAPYTHTVTTHSDSPLPYR